MGLREQLDVLRDDTRMVREQMGRELVDVRCIAQQSKDGLSGMHVVLASRQSALVDARDRISKLDSLQDRLSY